MRKIDKETLKQHKRSRSAAQPSLLGLLQPTTPSSGQSPPTSAGEGPTRKRTSQSATGTTGVTMPGATASEPPSPNHPHPLAFQSQTMDTPTSGSRSDDAVPSKRTSWVDMLHMHGLPPLPTQLFGSGSASPAESDTSTELHEKEVIRGKRGTKRYKEKRRREEIFVSFLFKPGIGQ
jgi:hypothetical protein